MRRWLWSRGYRYRKNDKRLPGKPDLVLKKYGVVIFIHGCFWHGHDHIRMPKTNAEFWEKKISRNRQRDEQCKQRLREMGWSVMTVWECQLQGDRQRQTLLEIEHLLNQTFLQRQSQQPCRKKAMPYAAPPETFERAAEERPD